MRCCRRLEGADGHAELAPRLQIIQRGVVRVLDRAHGLRAHERGGVVHDLLDQRESAPSVPSSASCPPGPGEPHVRHAQIVERAGVVDRESGRAALHEEG